MAQEILKTILSDLGETDIEIDNVVLLQIGCIIVSFIEEPPVESRLPVSELEKLKSETVLDISREDAVKNIQDKIVEALQKSPNVFDLNFPGGSDLTWFEPVYGSYLFGGRAFVCTVNIPHRMHKFTWAHLKGRELIEQFFIVSTGSTFGAYASITEYPASAHLGHEYRELARDLIESETEFKCPALGPCPIHPRYIPSHSENKQGRKASRNKNPCLSR